MGGKARRYRRYRLESREERRREAGVLSHAAIPRFFERGATQFACKYFRRLLHGRRVYTPRRPARGT